MKHITFYTTGVLATLSVASPTRTLAERASLCGQWDSVTTGSYIVYNNIWNLGNANSANQCIQVNGLTNDAVNWQASWSFSGGSAVKSYPNVVAKTSSNKQLSAIGSLKSSWAWTYTGSNMVANVAYDLFTSSTATGSNENEIMVWLAAFGGASPISASYGADGKPVPVATVTLAGQSWKLYTGSNGVNQVYSFLPASDGQIASFSGDINDFVKYLTNSQGLSKSQFLISAGAGTEPTSGNNAVFKTSSYSLVVA